MGYDQMCMSESYQIPQSVSSLSFWNLVIPFDLPADQEFDRQLLRLAGTVVFTAKPDFDHSSVARREGGVTDGFKIELGVSRPRFINVVCWFSGHSDMLSSRSGASWGRERWRGLQDIGGAVVCGCRQREASTKHFYRSSPE